MSDRPCWRALLVAAWLVPILAGGGAAAPITSSFHIDLSFLDAGLTIAQQDVLRQAADRWSEIILGDLPDVNGVDDLSIDVSVVSIDGVNQTLGEGGPTELRADTLLPFRGKVELDVDDVPGMTASGLLYDLALHEIGHVLGFGSIWEQKGLLLGVGGSDPRFIGPEAVLAYNRQFGTNEAGVPVENTGGIGTRDSHWRETLFGNELMSPILSASGNVLGPVTIAQMADLGYAIDPALLPPPLWQNPELAADVSHDGIVAANDAAMLVLVLNNDGPHRLPVVTGPGGPPPYLDVNGDGFVAANDAAMVINELNQRPSLETLGPGLFAAAEGELLAIVPEPATAALALGGLAVVLAARFRRK